MWKEMLVDVDKENEEESFAGPGDRGNLRKEIQKRNKC